MAALRRLSAMKATPSVFCSTTRRVASWTTCPGTVKSLSFTLKPELLVKKTGSRSKKSVRSSCVSTLSRRPRASGRAFAWMQRRLVVFPLSPGP